MPTPQTGETRDDFVSRCVPIVLDDGTADDNDQAVAICNSMYDEAKSVARARGDHLKVVASTDTELLVENHIILFGGQDLDEEYFDEATDLESDYTRSVGRLPFDFEHGFKVDGSDAPGRDDVLGYTDWSTRRKTDLGWLVQSVLDRRNEYVQAFEPLIEEGLMGTSSEAVPEGIVRRKGGYLAKWPLKRNSMTVEPAEPRMLGGNALTAIKHLCELSPKFAKTYGPILEAARKPREGSVDGAILSANQAREEQITMPVETTPAPEGQEDEAPDYEARFETLEGQLGQMSSTLDQLLTYLEDSPAARRAGLVAPGGEGLAPKNKSFGDFLIAVRFGDMKRLSKVYKTRIDRKAFAEKDLSGTTGSTAGILVPEEYIPDLLRVDAMTTPVMSMVTPIPVGGDSGKVPALDNYITPTAGSGQVAAAAGIKVANVAAGETLPETQPGFQMIQYLVSKVGGVVPIENEVMDDSPMAIEAILKMLFRIAIQAKNTRNVFRGSGAGEPLGILNANAAIPVTPATNNIFAYADALSMRSQFKSVGGRPAWFIHPGIWPDIGVFESSSGGGVWQANYQGQLGQTLLGWPIYEVEHLPQDDNSGCVVLADLPAYLHFQRAVLAIAFSEHARFESDRGVWRFTQRNDGKPWLLDKITLADPQGSYTVSPFVYLND